MSDIVDGCWPRLIGRKVVGLMTNGGVLAVLAEDGWEHRACPSGGNFAGFGLDGMLGRAVSAVSVEVGEASTSLVVALEGGDQSSAVWWRIEPEDAPVAVSFQSSAPPASLPAARSTS